MRANGVLRLAGWLILVMSLALPLAAAAQTGEPQAEGSTPEVWLVTYGPGQIYWQRFGHNAIWIRDPELGLDHTFNFGFFDFGQEDFFLRFLQGRMLYFSAAQPAREEFASYIDEDRSIRAQKLEVGADRALELAAYLLREIQPQNRDYLYDYYVNNCSTRVRDAIDTALGGELRQRFGGVPAAQDWRDHTRRLSAGDFWLYLGLEIVLGAPVDQPITAWDEMFIPEKLAEAVQELHRPNAEGGTPLVSEDVMLYESTRPLPPDRPHNWWPRYLLAALALLAAGALLARIGGRRVARALARGWLAVAGIAGLAMLFFWFGTDHMAARDNINVLLFNPLWLIPAAGRRTDKRVLLALAGIALCAAPAEWLPLHQYNLDVLAAFLPLHFGAMAALWPRAPVGPGRPGGKPGR